VAGTSDGTKPEGVTDERNARKSSFEADEGVERITGEKKKSKTQDTKRMDGNPKKGKRKNNGTCPGGSSLKPAGFHAQHDENKVCMEKAR